MAESRFASTRWSLVQLAGGERSPEGRAALEELCSRYWYPLYAFLRRSGRGPADAADLVQGLFTSLIERESLRGVDRDKGRFRSWLLGALKHHVANAYKRDQALKRGGGHTIVAIDVGLAETRYTQLVASREEPEDLFDRQWAQTVMERAFEALGAEYGARGQTELFEALREALLADGPGIDRARLAADLEMEDGALRVALHRMRKRLRSHLEDEVLETVGLDGDLQEEIADLLAALGRRS